MSGAGLRAAGRLRSGSTSGSTSSRIGWAILGLAFWGGCDPEVVLDPGAVGEAIETAGGSCDTDGDGARAVFCGGDDCDDRAPAIHPGAAERCDGVDDDCDGEVDEALGLGAPCVAFTGACAGRGVRVCTAEGAVACDAAPGLPGVEVCNDVDDDCDGTLDEGFGVGVECAVGLGACRVVGAIRCHAEDETRCDATPRPATAEMCDGVDNDCDGTADELLGIGEPCMIGVGRCRVTGRKACGAGGAVVCDGAPAVPGAETCDGFDDDCDGAVDEGFALGAACAAGVGVCERAGVFVCDGAGAARCDAVPAPAGVERCDGLDDDCDGAVDEGFALGAACAAGVGVCERAGVFVCDGAGAARCDAAPAPAGVERCDGLDDDCDGAVDEGLGLGAPCEVGVGACRVVGARRCDALGGVTCDASAAPPADERCNGIDDDCDGQIDEGFSLGAPCEVGLGACAAEGVRGCAADGGVICEADEGSPELERCDGVDNDCDALVDEVFAIALGEPCAIGVGACRAEGTQRCGHDGTLICDAPIIEPTAEACDGVDDDCDGSVDEGYAFDSDPTHCGACGRACEEVAFDTDICVDARCRRGCDADGECRHGQFCDRSAGVCVELDHAIALVDPLPERLIGFGTNVSVSESLLVVGDPLDTHLQGAEAGRAWVFDRRDGWSRSAPLIPVDTFRGDLVGAGVAAGEGVVVVGAPGEDGDANSAMNAFNDDAPEAGAAHVFGPGALGDWVQSHYLKAPHARAGDRFGAAVMLLGDVLFVGADGYDGGPGSTIEARTPGPDGAGAVYVYHRQPDGDWALVDLLRPPEPVARAHFGATLSAWSAQVAVGSASAVHVFEPVDGRWVESARIDRPTPEAPFAIAGDVLVFGEPEADGAGPGSGLAAVHVRDADGRWGPATLIEPASPDVGDGFGTTVAATPERIFVGAVGEDAGARRRFDVIDDEVTDAGAVYAFERRPGVGWVQTRYIKAPSPRIEAAFGGGLAVSRSTLAVGAPGELHPRARHNDITYGVVHVFEMTRAFDGALCPGARAPSAEVCDAVDSDCDGWVDEGFDVRLDLEHCGDCDALCGRADPDVDICVNGHCRRVCAPGLECPPGSYCGHGATAGYCPLLDGAYVKAPIDTARLGESVAISGDTLVAGSGDWGNADSTLDAPNRALLYAGGVFVYTRQSDGGWRASAYLKASNAGRQDGFGDAVAIDGDLIVVGAPSEDGGPESTRESPDNRASGAGAAYVFARQPDGEWSEVAYLKASNAGSSDTFGSAVAIEGGVIVVGAPAEDGDGASTVEFPNDNEADTGAAYVFERDGDGGWSQTGYLKAVHARRYDEFGRAVALSEGFVAVGAPGDDSRRESTLEERLGGAPGSGVVYVYARDADGWHAVDFIKANNTGSSDDFGTSVAMHGNRLVVGAPGEAGGPESTAESPDDTRRGAGAAYVFDRDEAGVWTQAAYLKSNLPMLEYHFGETVAVWGEGVVVGSPYEDGSVGSTLERPLLFTQWAGAAYLFTRDASGWALRRYLKAVSPREIDTMGRAVAIGEHSVVVGVPLDDGDRSSTVEEMNDRGEDSGALYSFER